MKRFSKITTTQLARICGVSQGTVDRALHNREGIKKETRERILSVAKEYDCLPMAENAHGRHSMLIGVVLFDLYNEFFSGLAMSLVEAAKQTNHSVIFQFSQKDLHQERAALEYFRYIGVDGIVLFSAGSDREDYRNYLRSLKIPLVLIGNPMPPLPFIGIDDEKAMAELTRRFAETLPAGEVLYYAPSLKEELHEQNAQRLRHRGFTQAMEALGRSYRTVTDAALLCSCAGLLCSTDHYLLQALKHLGYPKDLAIAGFDNLSFLKTLRQSIFTVEYSTDEIARQCMNYIFGRKVEASIPHRIVCHEK